MFLGKNTKNLRSRFTVFAAALTVLVSGASIANAQVPQTRLNDFQGNGRTSYTTLAFTTGGPIRWKVTGNPSSAAPNAAFKREFDFGLTDTDSLSVGDYLGDVRSEPTVWRDNANAVFYVGNFPTGTGGVTLARTVQFGNGATDIPGVQGDYDGDGKTDFTLVRVQSGNLVWYIMSSATNTARAVTYGSVAGIPSPNGATVFPGADFNGDGRDELIYLTRNSAGTVVNYFIGDAVTGTGVITRSFGNFNTDFSLAPDDYTGDGRADFIAVRQTQGANSVWYILNSQTNAVTATSFGLADPTFTDLDLPVRGDYDGDGRHDIAVWRPSNQTFYFLSSAQPGVVGGQKSGDATDFPLGSFGAF